VKIFKNILLIRAGSSLRNKTKHPLHCSPPLSLKYTQAALKRQDDYYIKIIDCWANMIPSTSILKMIDDQSFDLVVVSIDSPSSEAGKKLCKDIKMDQDVLIVAVGSDVTERYQDYLEESTVFDIIIRGEFELEIGTLLNQLNVSNDISAIKEYYNHKKVKNRFLVDRLDDLPSLTWDKAELERYPFIYPLRLGKKISSGYVLTSRGCPYGCSFCSPSVRKSYGKEMRLRSAFKVADEMEHLQKIGANVIIFEDDDFTVKKEHVRSVCYEIKKRRLDVRWACHARIDEVTPDLLKIMKEAGCILLLFGIESGSGRISKILQKTFSGIDWQLTAKRTFSEMKKVGIAACAMFIVGNPTETEEEVEDSIRLVHELKPDLIKVSFFTLYPGSTAYEQYINKAGNVSSEHHYLSPRINLSSMDSNVLKKAQLKFYRKVLLRPSFVLSHLYRYLFFYLNNWSRSWNLVRKGILFLLWSGKFKFQK